MEGGSSSARLSDGESDGFARRITAQAVARACLALDIIEAPPLAIAAVTDATASFIDRVGAFAKAAAEAGGRVEPNLTDFLAAFQMLSPPIRWQDIRYFAEGDEATHPWQQPFHHAVPNFPVRKRRRVEEARAVSGLGAPSSPGPGSTTPGSDDACELPRPPHVPAFMPPLPPLQTFRSTPVPSLGPPPSHQLMRQERIKRSAQAKEALQRILVGNEAQGSSAGRSSLAEPDRHWRSLAGDGEPLWPGVADSMALPPLAPLAAPLPPADVLAEGVARGARGGGGGGPPRLKDSVVDGLDRGGRILEGYTAVDDGP